MKKMLALLFALLMLCGTALAEGLASTETAEECTPPQVVIAGNDTIILTDSAAQPLVGLHLYGKTTQDGTPTPENPAALVNAASSGSATVTVFGSRNLLRGANAYTKDSPYQWTADNADSNKYLNELVASLTAGKTYTVSFCTDGTSGTSTSEDTVELFVWLPGATHYFSTWKGNQLGNRIVLTFTPEYSGEYIIRLDINQAGATHGFWNIQIEEGTAATAYTPYQDGESVTLTVADGLPGIPVAESGNYTDADGQQWLCDEIDLVRGVYIQRVGTLKLNGLERLSQASTEWEPSCYRIFIDDAVGNQESVLCSHAVTDSAAAVAYSTKPGVSRSGRYIVLNLGEAYNSMDLYKAHLAAQYAAGTPVTVLYELAHPVETALSDDVLAAYASMQTALSTMIITNDADADMAVEYFADPDIYDSINSISEGSFDPTPYGLPVLYLTGDVSEMTKANAVTLTYQYKGVVGTATVKWQGGSSLTYPKKNYTIKFDTKFEAKEGWGEHKKYCFKANFIDHSHARNIVSCKLWGQIVKSRANVPEELASQFNGGAIDGFPCVIVLNGEFHGLYTWNVPKDEWMFGEPKAFVMADDHTDATQFRTLATLDGDFELEYVEDEDHADWVLESLNRAIQAVMDSDGTDLDTTVGQYIDIPSAIDYYIYTVNEGALDCTDKNYILVTYDGVKWYFSAYDRDSIYGLKWDGSSILTPSTGTTYVSYAKIHRLMGLIYTYKTDELKARALELRNGVMSEANVLTEFANFAGSIPSQLLDEDARTWPTIPETSTSNVWQIIEWYRLRMATLDEELESMVQAAPVEANTDSAT